MASDNLTFISNNVTGIQQSSKRIKVFEYLKNNSLPNGFILFAWDTLLRWDKKQRSDNFLGKMFYSHGTTNSCGVAIAFFDSKSLAVVET